MSEGYLQLRKIVFRGPAKYAELEFCSGVNVICGASDTGKSLLAESIDFMLGGSSLREIPELVGYAQIELEISSSEGGKWQIIRSVSGGDFELHDLNADKSDDPIKLKENHSHGKTDNLSGFILEQIGLVGRRILKSSKHGTTQSLSFRNLARLIIIQEGEIQRSGSPFWSGQYTSKTSELATVKLLLTGVDDSAVISAATPAEPDSTKQVELIDEMIADLKADLADISETKEELRERFLKLNGAVESQQQSLFAVQRDLEEIVVSRRQLFEEISSNQARRDEISEHLTRFSLLRDHYGVDAERLLAIQESGSMFAHVEEVPCPLCGAAPAGRHIEDVCDGNVDAIVQAASAEIEKIKSLSIELEDTVAGLRQEAEELLAENQGRVSRYNELDRKIRETISPTVGDARVTYSTLVGERVLVQQSLDLYTRIDRLEDRKNSILQETGEEAEKQKVIIGAPDSVSHELSLKVETILKAWNFPGDCRVHYDRALSDFVIDGKPRGSRGKGLRAITHAAVTLALLEYCQEKGLQHPGFILLDSPLLAYYKPEGDDEVSLQGSDLKERFYSYLLQHHKESSQIIIVENQHPPQGLEKGMSLTVFTRNPNEGRFGLL